MILREKQTCLCLPKGIIPHNLYAHLISDFYYPLDIEIKIDKNPCWFPKRGELIISDDRKAKIIPYFREGAKLFAQCGGKELFKKGALVYYIPSLTFLEFLKQSGFCQIYYIHFQTIPLPIWKISEYVGKHRIFKNDFIKSVCLTLFTRDLRLLKPDALKYKEGVISIEFKELRTGYAVLADSGQIKFGVK